MGLVVHVLQRHQPHRQVADAVEAHQPHGARHRADAAARDLVARGVHPPKQLAGQPHVLQDLAGQAVEVAALGIGNLLDACHRIRVRAGKSLVGWGPWAPGNLDGAVGPPGE
jgi:hypothetical protein